MNKSDRTNHSDIVFFVLYRRQMAKNQILTSVTSWWKRSTRKKTSKITSGFSSSCAWKRLKSLKRKRFGKVWMIYEILFILFLAYPNCANDPFCAASAVQGYMKRYAFDSKLNCIANRTQVTNWEIIWFVSFLRHFYITAFLFLRK